jgi:hypothetical protein
MSANNQEGKHVIPKWLKELQDNSWELELLISGGAIFTLFQVSEIWLNWLESMSVISFLPGRAIFILLGTLGLETLKLGFILHLILRSYWLAMVCINYVFPEGIRKDRVKWKKPFAVRLNENEDLQGQIVAIDKLCGLVMYLSIISTFLLSGIIFTIFATISIPIINQINTGIVGVIFLFAFFVYIADLLFAGILRKIPYLSYLVYPFFKLYDLLTFRRIYQKPAMLFYSNITYWKFTLSALLFFSIAGTISYLNTYKIMHWPNVFDERDYRWQMVDSEEEFNYTMYKDELLGDKIPAFHIQSKIIKENYIELFVQYRVMFDELVGALPGKKDEKFLSEIIGIAIDDSTYQQVDWFRTTNKSALGLGLTAIIPIDHLEDGKHIIKLGCSDKLKARASEIEYFDEKCREFIIPFWKDTKVTLAE